MNNTSAIVTIIIVIVLIALIIVGAAYYNQPTAAPAPQPADTSTIPADNGAGTNLPASTTTANPVNPTVPNTY